MERLNVPLIGITGGIASGKSFVTEQLKRNGAAIISADQMAHEVLKLAEVKQEARERWGDPIFSEDGEIDRSRLGAIVFAPPPEGPQQLKVLEGLTHPRIRELIGRQITEINERGSAGAIVLDVPLLFESGWNKFCTTVWFVEAPLEVRQARASERGWSGAELARREAVQMPIEQKRQLADVIIDNSGTAQATRSQIDQQWQALISATPSR
jgi:dephospho-CoA kinase